MSAPDVMVVNGQQQDADVTPPTVTPQAQAPPDLGQPTQQPTLAPQPVKRPVSSGAPLLGQMLAEVFKQPTQMQAPAPGQIATARPVSRTQDFEGFLSQFLYSLGQGFANEGRGPGAAYRGAGAAMQAPIQLAQTQQAMQQRQAQIAQQQAQTQQTQAQTGMIGQMAYIPGIGMVPVNSNLARGAGAAEVTGQAGMAKQALANQGKLNQIQLQTQIMAGSLSKMVPDVVNGQQGYRMFNKFGQEIGFSDATVIPQLMARTSSTVSYQQDADGNIVALPKTTVTRPNIPGGVQPTAQPGVRPAANAGPVPGVPAIAPRAAGTTPTGPPINQPTATPQQAGGPRVVMQGKAAKDVGKAFDPQSGDWVETTRSQAPQQGYQQFTKYTGKEQEDYRQLNNRLADVATKISRYEDSLKDPVSGQDLVAMQQLLASDKWKLGAFGAEIPVDQVNQAMNGIAASAMSKAARNRVLAYANARESLQGYQRVLTGGSHSSETGLQLQLAAMPPPTMPDAYTQAGIDQFKENINVAGQGLPRQLGMTRARDIFAQRARANLSPQLRQILDNSFGGTQTPK